MSSIETRRRPSGIDVIVYVIAIAAWGLAIIFQPNQLNIHWVIDVPLPHYLVAASAAAALIALAIAFFFGRAGAKGSLLFIPFAAAAFYTAYLVNYYLEGRDDFNGAAALFLTPIFCVVIGVYLALRHGWGLPKLFVFTLVIGFAHFYATDFAVEVHDDTSIAFQSLIDRIPVPLENTMIVPGFVGGIIGAGLSFLGLSIAGRGFRKPVILILFTLILGVVGAIGLAASAAADEDKHSLYVWLYPPWQVIFGFMLARLAGKVGTRGN